MLELDTHYKSHYLNLKLKNGKISRKKKRRRRIRKGSWKSSKETLGTRVVFLDS